MSADADLERFLLSGFLNLPLVAAGIVYWLLSIESYHRHRDARALREFVLATGIMAGGLAYWAVAYGVIAQGVTVLEQPWRSVSYAARTMVLATLAIAILSWLRNERR